MKIKGKRQKDKLKKQRKEKGVEWSLLSLRRARGFLGPRQEARERFWDATVYIFTPEVEVNLRVPPWYAISFCLLCQRTESDGS